MRRRESNFSSEYSSSILIGFVAGLRSMAAPAVTARTLVANGFETAGSGWMRVFARPSTARNLALAAAGELLVDKLPIAPNRTAPASLLWRIVSGAVCGATVAQVSGREPRIGAMAGAAGAVIGSYAGEHIRRLVGQTFAVPDVLVAIGEDAVTALGAYSVARSLQPPRRLERIPA